MRRLLGAPSHGRFSLVPSSRSPVAFFAGAIGRSCATGATTSPLGIAPKKARPAGGAAAAQMRSQMAAAVNATAAASASESTAATTVGVAPPVVKPQADAEFSSDAISEKLEQLSKLSPQQLESLMKELGEKDEATGRVLADDGVHQMDVSLTPKYQGGLKVFWKTVSTYELPSVGAASSSAAASHKWYGVALDGRKVKAFESTVPLTVPTLDFAAAIAHEYGTQQGMLNKLIMPLTDLASGAHHVSPQAVIPRIDYLMSFFRNDNLYFRAESIADEQDAMIDPIKNWWERYMGVEAPRIVGLGHTHFPPHVFNHVRDSLIRLDMNPYQVVALCVVAQHTASLMLPLAMFNGACDIETALKINRAEEGHNLKEHGSVKGYHDIRESDIVVKIAASLVAWKATQDVTAAECARMMTVVPQPI